MKIRAFATGLKTSTAVLKKVFRTTDLLSLGTLKIPKARIPDAADYTLDDNCPDGVSKSDDCFGFNSCVGGMKYKMDCPTNLSKLVLSF